ncbi:hypothetical protein ACVWYG_001988 [Pedobacter sp. UYEF25]
MSSQKAIFFQTNATVRKPQIWMTLAFKRFRINTRALLILLTSLIAFAQILLHLIAINAYGFHEDELLYILLGNHLAWGYIETGPLIAVVGDVSKAFFGDSLIAMRIFPAIFAAVIVLLTGIVTIRLGGKYLAVIIACTAVAFSPAFLASGALFIPQVFDELFWLLTAYLVVCWIQKPKDNYLYGLGVVIGLGILLKYTLILYVFGILLGILFTPKLRGLFKTKAFYLAILISIIVLLPHLVWQFEHRLPALTHYHELKKTQLNYLYRIDFLIQQLLVNGPAVFVWLAGLIYLFYSKKLKQYRFFGISFFTVMIVLAILKGKPYYGFGAYPPLFVTGALFLEKFLNVKNQIIKALLLFILIVPNLLLSVIVLPLLPIENAAKVFYWARCHLGITFTVRWEDQKIHSVNQNYADMIGWEELAQKTSALYKTLAPAEKKKTIIYTESYGIASAMSYYGKYYPLPKVVSLNGSLALWAPNNIDNNLVIYYLPPLVLNPVSGINRSNKYVINNQFSRLFGTQICISKNPASKKIAHLAYSLAKSKARF